VERKIGARGLGRLLADGKRPPVEGKRTGEITRFLLDESLGVERHGSVMGGGGIRAAQFRFIEALEHERLEGLEGFGRDLAGDVPHERPD
jgi:hypothetical protein